MYIMNMSIHIYNGLDRNSVTRMANLFYRIVMRAFCFPLLFKSNFSPFPFSKNMFGKRRDKF